MRGKEVKKRLEPGGVDPGAVSSMDVNKRIVVNKLYDCLEAEIPELEN